MPARRQASRSRVLPFPPPVTPIQDGPGEEAPDQGRAMLPHRGQGAQGEAGQVVRELRFHGVYVISVASRLLQMHPQTLRKYERFGLVSPSRTEGMLRLYSDSDIARLRMIKHLVETRGLNLSGVEMALNLLDHVLEARLLAEGVSGPARRGIQDEIVSMLELLHFSTPPDSRGGGRESQRRQ